MRPDRITELLEANNHEVERRRAVVHAARKLRNTLAASADVLEYATAEGIGFIPWAPVSAGELARPGGPVDTIARDLDVTPAQVALAWVLQASPVMLPIPGTGSVPHLEDNLGAATVTLPASAVAELDSAA